MTPLPLTKFRIPRLRSETVERPELLARLERAVADDPVTVLCAPGGSGKTTLLAQLATRAAAGSSVVWISIDEDDDDANRLFATLTHGLEPLQLAWETEPEQLIARVAGTGAQSRAALATLVNALCTSVTPRILIVLDDLHRIGRPDAFALLDSLVERLPDHVTLLMGTRVEPPLQLARWRAHGELGEFSLDDLRFTEEEATRLAASAANPIADERMVHEALARTQGWAVGLTMLLQSRWGAPRSGRGSRGATGEAAQRNLFAYLAKEVLGSLPRDLQDFVLRTAILTELEPGLCHAVTGREDAAAVLEDLYRRNLFLTAIDDSVPVLRFHDLFREFLESELARRLPSEVRALHERAARSEVASARVVHHFLAAGCWDEAIRRILEVGESLLAEGGVATVERWIEQVPETARAGNPRLSYLTGTIAWMRWDWARAQRELVPAVEGLTDPAEARPRVRAMFQLVDALNSSGDLRAAWARLEEVSRLPLDDLGQAELALQCAWCLAPAGEVEAVARYMQEFVAHAERNPATICPVTAGRVHCMLIGLPGIADTFDRFAALCNRIAGPASAPWQLAALAVEGWARIWQGERAAAGKIVARAEDLYHRFGSIRLVGERLGQVKAVYSMAVGRHADAIAIARRHLAGLEAPEVAWHSAVWLRSYRHALARMYWIAGEPAGFFEVLPHLIAPRTPVEWPYNEVAADTVRGQAALLRSDARAAIEPFEQACEGYARHRMPAIFCDPRVGLAYAWSALGDRKRAWQAFEPTYREVTEEGAYGLLVLDSRRHVTAVLDALPADVRRAPETEAIRRRLAEWAPEAAAGPEPQGPLASLTERELEVLEQVAAGAGNKHIARDLDLSLHTVKRHIANILDKLDCASRGQAADLYRRQAG